MAGLALTCSQQALPNAPDSAGDRRMPLMILTIVGPDRPGLVRSLAAALTEAGGNWLESRLARLAGHFAGIVTVEAPESFLPTLATLETGGLRITATLVGAAAPASGGHRLRLEATSQDRPGIVQEVTQVVARHGANIEDMTTSVEHAAFSGELHFKAVILMRLADEAAADAVRAGLEGLSDDMVVDVQTLEA